MCRWLQGKWLTSVVAQFLVRYVSGSGIVAACCNSFRSADICGLIVRLIPSVSIPRSNLLNSACDENRSEQVHCNQLHSSVDHMLDDDLFPT